MAIPTKRLNLRESVRHAVRPWCGCLSLDKGLQRSKLSLFGMIALLIVSVNLPARQSDRTQPISIKADRSTFDERSGQQTLSGNVQITQGTMRISADFIAVSLEDNALSLIEGRGSPIQFQQENESGELIRGEAQEVVYNAQSNTLILQGNAKLSQPNQQLSSDRITFDANTQKVDAQGGTDNGRVSIQIQPPKSQ